MNCIPAIPYPDSDELPKQPLFRSESIISDTEKARELSEAEKSPPIPLSSQISAFQNKPIHMMYQPIYPMTAIQAMHTPYEQPIVTNDLIIQEIRRLLNQSDLDIMTKKTVRKSLSQIFQINLDDRKAFINMCIDKILQGEL